MPHERCRALCRQPGAPTPPRGPRTSPRDATALANSVLALAQGSAREKEARTYLARRGLTDAVVREGLRLADAVTTLEPELRSEQTRATRADAEEGRGLGTRSGRRSRGRGFRMGGCCGGGVGEEGEGRWGRGSSRQRRRRRRSELHAAAGVESPWVARDDVRNPEESAKRNTKQKPTRRGRPRLVLCSRRRVDAVLDRRQAEIPERSQN